MDSNVVNALIGILCFEIAFLSVLIFNVVIRKKPIHFTLVNAFSYLLAAASFAVLPVMYFIPSSHTLLWDLSLYAAFILMCIRPSHNLFPRLRIIKFLPLRKELGIFSALIVVAFAVLHNWDQGFNFILNYFSVANWSFENYEFFGRLGEFTGLILLVTSNRFSMRLLKRNWKRIQRLSYVYFFSGAWFVFANFEKTFGMIAMLIVFQLTLFAFFKNRRLLEKLKLFEDGFERGLAAMVLVLLVVGVSGFGFTLFELSSRSPGTFEDLSVHLNELSFDVESYEFELEELERDNDELEASLFDLTQRNYYLDLQLGGEAYG